MFIKYEIKKAEKNIHKLRTMKMIWKRKIINQRPVKNYRTSIILHRKKHLLIGGTEL